MIFGPTMVLMPIHGLDDFLNCYTQSKIKKVLICQYSASTHTHTYTQSSEVRFQDWKEEMARMSSGT